MQRVQVIVSGAGPAGVVLANRLAQRGVDVLLLEAFAEPPLDLRASTFHPPTLDMMDELGFIDALEAQGLRAPVYQYRNRKTGEVLSLNLGELADVMKHPYRLQCEQYKLARLGVARLAETGHGTTLFQHRVVHFEQDGNGVTVHAETPFGIETFQADYLVAAEGANSITRKWLGVQFEGFTYAEKFLTLSTEYPMEKHFDDLAYVNYMADSEEWCVLLRTPTVWRVLVPAAESDPDAVLLADPKKNAVFDGLMGDGSQIVTEHRTIYRVHQRVADRYDHGRVVLMGDAAHLNNPLGGLGMNSGVHDAWNLADKLSAILQDGGDRETLLARYDRQRRTVMQEFVQAQTIKNKKAMESPDQQKQAQDEMRALTRDGAKRREYLLNQAMVRSLEREAEIA